MSMESPTKDKTMVSAVLTMPGNPTSRFPPIPNPDGAAGAEYEAVAKEKLRIKRFREIRSNFPEVILMLKIF